MKLGAPVTTFHVPMALHAQNRARLVERLRAHGATQGVVLLQGAPSTYRFDTDHEPIVRQESFFQWAFGAKEPDLYGAIDVATGAATLFIPRLPAEYAVWMGAIRPPADFVSSYAVDACRYVDELAHHFAGTTVIYRLRGRNTDSGSDAVPATFKGIEATGSKLDDDTLFRHIVELRVRKTALELDLLRYVCHVSSAAHKAVMREVKPGMKEYQVEALFRFHCHFDGACRHMAYTCICAAGTNAATLHYGHAGAPNDKTIEEGQMVLFDMGAEYHCYCSDLTCSYPVSGKFTPDQALIYNAVLSASQAVIAAMRPGVVWADMHRLAVRTICQALRQGGLVQGSDEELAKHHVGALFMPHGLGHFLGLDTHDVGGYGEGQTRIMEPGLKSLRCGRVLEESMVITVEPGVYFIAAVLEPAFRDPVLSAFLNESRIRPFMGSGGVRIEDDVVVTRDGCENLSAGIPRTVEAIEQWMSVRVDSVALHHAHH